MIGPMSLFKIIKVVEKFGNEVIDFRLFKHVLTNEVGQVGHRLHADSLIEEANRLGGHPQVARRYQPA